MEKKETKTTTSKATPKTTARKTATKTSTTKATSTTKNEDKKLTINDIPKELMEQITSQILNTLNISSNTSDTLDKKEDIKVEETKNKPTKCTKSYLNSNKEVKQEEIEVKSIYEGEVNFVSPKSGIRYKWLEKGSTEYLTVEELLSMESNSLRFLHTPWLIVSDERIIQAFKLEKLYSTIKEVADLETFLDKDISHIETVVNDLPREYKIELISDIYNGIKNKTLKIDYLTLSKLQELLNYNFIEE